jgi:hypothetical protein
MKGPAESGQICSVGRRKIAKKIAKNKRCYANTLRPRSRTPMNVERKLSLSRRMRSDRFRVPTLFIVTLRIFALVRRHVTGIAPRTVVVALCGPDNHQHRAPRRRRSS